MKRIDRAFSVHIADGLFVLPASAESAASRVDTYCTVSRGRLSGEYDRHFAHGACHYFHEFPLPANATGITLNGASVSTSKTSSATMVDISRVVSGITGEIPPEFQLYTPQVRGRCDR